MGAAIALDHLDLIKRSIPPKASGSSAFRLPAWLSFPEIPAENTRFQVLTNSFYVL
jgi:hypothetical protein